METKKLNIEIQEGQDVFLRCFPGFGARGEITCSIAKMNANKHFQFNILH